MAVQKQDDQHEHTFSSYVRIQDVVLKTYLGRWTIWGEWRERVRDIRATSTTWRWWYIYTYSVVFIIKGFRTIVFIFIGISKRFGWYVLRPSSVSNSEIFILIVISTIFRPLFPGLLQGSNSGVFIFIVISITFRPISLPAFFRCLLHSGTYTELRITSFIESTGVTCSYSVSHNCVQVLLLTCSQVWTCNLQKIVS